MENVHPKPKFSIICKMNVSDKMIDKICLLETGKKFRSKLGPKELNGVYVSGDSSKVGKHKTYGYGLLVHPNGKFMDQVKNTYTQQEIESLYIQTVNKFGNKILHDISKPLKQCQLDALVCIKYNFGSVPSKLLQLVNQNPDNKDIYNVWIHLSDSQYKRLGNRVKGLLTRRKMEADWYFGNIS